MTTSGDQIVSLYAERKDAYGPVIARMDELTQAYNGDLVVPLPEMDKMEKAAVANFIVQGVDQIGMRIGSTQADVWYPPEKPGESRSELYARIRRQATLGWWKHSQLDVMIGRRARHLLGYGCAPVVILPDFKNGVPRWHIRSPLSTFPSQTDDPDGMCPDDCIFAYHRSRGWLEARYPAEMRRLEKGDTRPDAMFELVEYVDGDEIVLLIVGRQPTTATSDTYSRPASTVGERFVEVARGANLTGRCTAVVPGRITLDRRQGRFDSMIGMYLAEAKLMALELIAVRQGVFPKEWLVARQNEQPKVLVEADGQRGVTGVVQGGELTSVTTQPSYMTAQTIDRIEKAQQVQGGLPADFSGQSGTGIRTGKRGMDIISAVVDFPVQEAHTLFSTSREYENQIAIACAKGHFGDTAKSFYVNWKGAKGRVDYTPNKHFTDDTNFVAYPHAGSDLQELEVGIGQRIATHQISIKTSRRLDPLIDDPDFEESQTMAEALEAALLAAIQAEIQQEKLSAVDVAKLDVAMKEGKGTLAEVWMEIHKQEQERQATPVPQGAPEAMPGMAGPGQTAMQPPGQIGPTPDEQGLASLLGALHGDAKAA